MPLYKNDWQKYAKKKKKHLLLSLKKKKTDNNKIRGVALINKIATQRSLCTVRTSRKSTFLKPIKPIKSRKQFLQIIKTWKLIV